jgi:hypothetical protein
MRFVALTLGVGIAFAAASGLRAHERITTTVTWDREISAIVRTRCVTCHRDGGRAPMSLATWAEARPWARAIRHEVMTRRMPVWHAARGYGDFANDPSLSPFEIALVTAWVDGGAPRSFVPRGSPAIRLPGPPEAPLVPTESPSAPPSAAAVREVLLPCGDSQAPTGRLLGLRPELPEHGSARVTAALTNGAVESLGWFRDFATDFATTYWLRTPLTLGAGSRIQAVTPVAAPQLIERTAVSEPCRIVLVFARG